MRPAGPRILVLDNRDSFTFNVVQALREGGARTGVVDSRRVSVQLLESMRLDGLVISPGPGRPADAGVSLAAIERLAATIPIWGICLGHQCLAEARGARVRQAGRILHGKTSAVRHDSSGLFAGLPAVIEVMRYHSLIVEAATVPANLTVTAWTDDGEVMGLRCRDTGAEGVQFHPESVLSVGARPLFTAFVERCDSRRAALEGIA